MSRVPINVTPAEAPPPPSRWAALHASFGRGRVDASGTFLLQVLSLGLGLVANIAVARIAGVSGFGVYSYAIAWSAMFTQPSLLGLDRILIRELATYQAGRRFGLMRGLLRRAGQVALLAGSLFALCALAVAIPVSHPAARASVALGLLIVPLAALGRVQMASLQGLRRSSLAQLTQSVGRTVYFLIFLGAALLIAASRHVRPSVIVSMQVLAFGAAFVTGAIAVRAALPHEARERGSEYDSRRWLKTMPVLAGLTGLMVVNSQLSVILLGTLGTSADTGRFNAAFRGAVLVSLGLTAVGAVIAPRIATLYAAGDLAGIERILLRGARAASALAIPPALILILLGPWILSLFGHGFREANTTLVVLVIGQVVNAATGAVGVALVMTRHEQLVTGAWFVGTVLLVVLCVILIPIWGATGAAIATAGSVAFINISLMVVVWRKLGLRSTPWLIRTGSR